MTGFILLNAGGEFGHDVQVADVPGVLLQQVKQDPLESRGVRAVPAFAGLSHLVQVVGLDDGLAPRGLLAQAGQQGGERLVGIHPPAATFAVAPRVTDVTALEAPLQPAQFHVAQVLGQFERRPARRQPAAPQLVVGQRLELLTSRDRK